MRLKLLFMAFFLSMMLPFARAAGSDWTTATPITGGNSYTGQLSGSHPEDWYKLVIPEKQNGTVQLAISSKDGLDLNYISLRALKEGEVKERNFIFCSHEATGDTMTVNDIAAGTYYVLVKHYERSGSYTLKYTFTPNPTPNDEEPNDAYDKGGLIENGAIATGHLGYLYHGNDTRDTDDWYKIVIPEKQNGTVQLAISSKDGLDLNYISLRALKDGEVKERNGIYCDHEATGDTLTVNDIAAGTYYVRVKHWANSGSYSLKYTFTPNPTPNDEEPNDAYDKGGLIENGAIATGHLGYLYHGEDTRDTDDWYKIVIPEKQNGTVQLAISSKDGLNIHYIWLHALKDGEVKERNGIYCDHEATGDTMTVKDIAAGTYYVRVRHWASSGSYALKYTFTPNPTPNDEEPNDVYDKGGLIENGATVTGHLGYVYHGNDPRDTDDWYKIVIPEKQNGTVQLAISSKDGLNIHYIWLHALKDGEVKERNGIYCDHETTGDTMTVNDIAAGTYYVRVRHWASSGSYALKYTFTPNPTPNDEEPNDAYGQGKLLQDNTTVTGHLGYLYHGEDTRDHEDWYRIELASKGIVLLSIKPDSLSTLDINYLSLLKPEGEKLKEVRLAYVGRKSVQMMLNDMEAGTYYVKVRRWSGSGDYSLSYGNPTPMQGSTVKIDVTGRNKVRLGVPCRYTVTVRNESGNSTGSFLLTACATDDIKMLGAEFPTNNGVRKLSAAEVGNEDESAMWFVVPTLAPYQSYTFDIIAEGRAVAQTRFAITTTLLVGAIGSIVSGLAADYASDQICEYASNAIELTPAEQQQYIKALGKGVEQVFQKEAKDGVVVFTAKSVLGTTGEKIIEMFPLGSLVTKVGKGLGVIKAVSTAMRHRLFYWLYKQTGLINENNAILDAKVGADGVVASWDPNEKTGPKGSGENNYLAKPQRMTYTIFFENKKEATAPAYRIRIEDTLADIFDLESVEFGPTSHSGDGYYWQMKREGNKLTWDIEGIELPPNVNAPEGEGFVTFSANLKPGVGNGTVIENKATVIFDKNAPIVTNVWKNVIDTEAPVTTMQPVSYAPGTEHLTVTCQSDDKDGSGIDRYLYYVSDNGAPFTFFAETNEAKLEYPVDMTKANNYSFYALAVDKVGNTEQSIPEAVSINTQLGIDNIVADRLTASPNPSDGLFRLTLPSGVTELTVFNAAGQAVWMAETSTIANNMVADLTRQPAGTYLLKAVVNGETKVVKLMRK